MKALIAYFSAESGRTANVAKSLAAAIGADLFEIKPEKPYTSSDLNYMNPLARCNREHITKKQVPVSGKVENFVEYVPADAFIEKPNVVNTFCKEYDFTGKKVAAFATSGGSGIGKTAEKLKPYVSGADVIDAKLMNGVDEDTLKRWVDGL